MSADLCGIRLFDPQTLMHHPHPQQPTHLSLQNLLIIPQTNCRRIATGVCVRKATLLHRKASCGAPKPCTEVCAKACAEVCAEVCADVAPKSTGFQRNPGVIAKRVSRKNKNMLRRKTLWSFLSPSLLLTLELFVANISVSSRPLLNTQTAPHPMDPIDSRSNS